jgi:hypothetical protein
LKKCVSLQDFPFDKSVAKVTLFLKYVVEVIQKIISGGDREMISVKK